MFVTAGDASSGGYTIANSLRFRSSASARLSRSFSTPTSNTTWTWSGWVKRGALGATHTLFSGNLAAFGFNSSDQLVLWGNAGSPVSNSTAVYRDPTAHGHLLVVSNGTTITFYWNNVSVISYTGTATNINTTTTHYVGCFSNGPQNFFDGLLSDIYFIDGQALTPSSFGETNADGVWVPKKYTGTYGTNGFWLPFTGGTGGTIGNDASGNGNNWSSTGHYFTSTTNYQYDWMTDTPTNNYATLNPLTKASQVTLTGGNLDAAHGTFGASTNVFGTIHVSSGKWYWEVTVTALSSGAPFIGIAKLENIQQNFTTLFTNTAYGWGYRIDGTKRTNNSDASYGSTYTTNDVIGVALDLDAGTLVFYKNNVSQGTAYSSLSGSFCAAEANATSGGTFSTANNFGQRPFSYSVPTGFKALATSNSPSVAITNPRKHFDVKLWLANQTDGKSVTGLAFQPDFFWAKERVVGRSHNIFDAVRGVTKSLRSDGTDAEQTIAVSATGKLKSFNSDGVTFGADTDTSYGSVNYGSTNHVGWFWKANGSGVTNTAGSITSTVSANTTAGFSIVTYTGTGANATVGHGLGVALKMVIIFRRNAAEDHPVYVEAVGNTKALRLNSTASSGTADIAYWNNTSPTSTTFSLGTWVALNGNTDTYVAYCFAEVQGFSKFGSYVGTGAADGPFIFTGFRPRYVLVKRSDAAENWMIWDAACNTFNVSSTSLRPNISNAESTAVGSIDILSNGFKLRTDGTLNGNANGGTFIFAAFAEFPNGSNVAPAPAR